MSRINCPFNPSHITTEDKLLNHLLNKCSNYQRVKDQYSQCQYDFNHFVLT
jgi:hypothetical protein